MFADAFAGRRVLVTGHTGFKGSWLAFWLTRLGAQVSGVSLDPDTEPAHWTLLDLPLRADLRIDVRDRSALRAALVRERPEVVFHLAAQPLVRRGYREPLQTFDTNVGGLVNLLDAIRAAGSTRAVVVATTDKVYEEDGARAHEETDALGGKDPYSASKAASEIVAHCWRTSYFDAEGGPGLATARAGNVIGGGDWSEDRIVPDIVRAITTGSELALRNPGSVRPWQHVLEPLSGYLRLAQGLFAGEDVRGAWNFGPAAGDQMPVRELVEGFARRWPSLRTRLDDGVHPPEAPVLRLDWRKAASRLGWRPVWTAARAVARTADWYEAFGRDRSLRTQADLDAYVDDARAAGLRWASA